MFELSERICQPLKYFTSTLQHLTIDNLPWMRLLPMRLPPILPRFKRLESLTVTFALDSLVSTLGPILAGLPCSIR